MPGELVEDTVIIRDQKEGSQFHNRGFFGYPRSGGGLDLDLIEATFLLQSGKLTVVQEDHELSFPELFRHSASMIPEFDIKYLVYTELRSRGFIVKPDSGDYDLRVYGRGDLPNRSREKYWVKAVSERSKFDIIEFFRLLALLKDDKRELLYGVVDEEGDITYYVVSYGVPKAKWEMTVPDELCQGTLVQDRVFVFDPLQASALMDAGFFGKLMGEVLQLSIIESAYLVSKGVLEVDSSDGRLEVDALVQFGERHQDEFSIRKDAYFHLRDEGLLVKTGFKYGTHFRMYEDHPDKCHARYLVHATSAEKGTSWPEISRAVRLAHGVKKEILFSMVGDKGVELLGFRRIRP